MNEAVEDIEGAAMSAVGQPANVVPTALGDDTWAWAPGGQGGGPAEQIVSVRDFGAIGDGETDDQQAFTDAITAAAETPGTSVYVPAGTYIKAGAPIPLPSNVRMYGDGMGLSIIKNADGSTAGQHVLTNADHEDGKRAIAAIPAEAWQGIKYTDAIYDEQTRTWISRAEVAEIPFPAFTSKKTDEQVPGRLIVRRIPDLNPKKDQGQATLFDTWRFHAFFTTVPAAERDTVAADKAHRAHAIIENVHADLKAFATPSGNTVFRASRDSHLQVV